jgi:Uma2 family endonuclease
MSLSEFLDTPEDETGPKYELEYGELIEMTRPTFEHNELLLSLSSILLPYIRTHNLGRLSQDIMVVLDEPRELAYAPDLVFVATEHLDCIRSGRVYGAPDLVVEVLSPSTASRDHLTKLDVYLKSGIPWYWIVDPKGPGIEEYSATDSGYLRTATIESNDTFRPGIFPDLSIDLESLTP